MSAGTAILLLLVIGLPLVMMAGRRGGHGGGGHGMGGCGMGHGGHDHAGDRDDEVKEPAPGKPESSDRADPAVPDRARSGQHVGHSHG